MIEVENLSKRYGEKLAVDGLSFLVQPGIVTGFQGPNGAGKSTTMRGLRIRGLRGLMRWLSPLSLIAGAGCGVCVGRRRSRGVATVAL